MKRPTVALGEVTSVITKGTTPTSVGLELSDSGIPFLRVQNLVRGKVDLTVDPMHISESTHLALRRSAIFPKDVLISIAGTIGRAALVSENSPRMNCNQEVAIIRCAKALEPAYLTHWIQSSDALRQIRAGKVTGTIANLSLTEISNLSIVLPTLEEQRRIAAILDKADALRQKRRAALQKLDSLTQSLFLDMFGDPAILGTAPRTQLREVLLSMRNGANVDQDAGEEGWPITRIETISHGIIDSVRVGRVAPDASLISEFRLEIGDIIFSHINSPAHIGKTALYKGIPGNLIHGINLMRLRCDLNKVAPIWLLQLLKLSYARDHYRTRCKKAVNQASLNQRDIGDLTFPLPRLTSQHQFATQVTKVDGFSSTLLESAADLDLLFTSLQHRAFRGEL